MRSSPPPTTACRRRWSRRTRRRTATWPLVVDPSVAAADVADALRAGAGDLLESLRLFDVYAMPDVRRSLAFRLMFRAPDRTLTAEEANEARDAAVAAAAARTGAVLRGPG